MKYSWNNTFFSADANKVGEELEKINDEIDYQALSSAAQLMITVSDGTASRRITIKKHAWEPLGLCLDETEAMKARHCKNKYSINRKKVS